MGKMYHKSSLMGVAILASVLIMGCSGALTPYRIEVRQGNYITQSMAENIKEGMTKDQVRFFLGMPLLQDIFHQNRWDFAYQYSPGKFGRQKRTARSLTIFFDDEGLVKEVKIQDDLPTDRPPVLIVLEPKDKEKEKEKETEKAEDPSAGEPAKVAEVRENTSESAAEGAVQTKEETASEEQNTVREVTAQ